MRLCLPGMHGWSKEYKLETNEAVETVPRFLPVLLHYQLSLSRTVANISVLELKIRLYGDGEIRHPSIDFSRSNLNTRSTTPAHLQGPHTPCIQSGPRSAHSGFLVRSLQYTLSFTYTMFTLIFHFVTQLAKSSSTLYTLSSRSLIIE